MSEFVGAPVFGSRARYEASATPQPPRSDRRRFGIVWEDCMAVAWWLRPGTPGGRGEIVQLRARTPDATPLPTPRFSLSRRSLRTLVWTTVAVLVGLLLLTAIATSVARMANRSAQHDLDQRWLPGQVAVGQLTAAYLEEETGLRGFLLTGDPAYLRPYRAGTRHADALLSELQAVYASERPAAAAVTTIAAAGRDWRTRVAAPAIAARSENPLSSAQLATYTGIDKTKFDRLRRRLATLGGFAVDLVRDALDSIAVRQTVTIIIAAVAFALAFFVAIVSVPLVRRALIWPLNRLVAQIQAVAAGAEDHQIDPVGPSELQRLAAAAEQMRHGLVDRAHDLVDTQHRLTLRDERDRIAADLHDHTIQQIFGLGLSLSAIASARPEMQPLVDPVIDRIDAISRDLRGVIFGLRGTLSRAQLSQQIRTLVADSARMLGFGPTAVIDPEVDQLDPDIAEQLIAALREALANVARHARATALTVALAIDRESPDAVVQLVVADNGVGMQPGHRDGDGLTNLRARAQRLGGDLTIETEPGAGMQLTWEVPARGTAPPR